jgi:hypothetical protein
VYLPNCYYVLQEIELFEIGTTSSGMTPITDFLKIGQLFQTLTGWGKGMHADAAWSPKLIFFSRKGIWLMLNSEKI